MLGVPPAFVLSQDQTLHKFVSYSACSHMLLQSLITITRNYCGLFWSALDLLASILSLELNKGSSFFFLPSLALFSFQDAVAALTCDFPIIPHFVSFVKAFLKLFLIFWSLSFLKLVSPPLVRQLIYYTTPSTACQLVFRTKKSSRIWLFCHKQTVNPKDPADSSLIVKQIYESL